MTKNDFPEEVLKFLQAKINSVEQLHILLLLSQRSGEIWTTISLSQELRSTPSSVDQRLKCLLADEVLSAGSFHPDGTIHFFPANPDIEKTVQRLSDFYRLCPHKVVACIFAKPSTGLQSFSDAFRFTSKKERL